MLFRALAFVVVSLIAAPSFAADDPLVPPLEQYARLPDDRQDPAYAPTRCAGLYVGLLRYGGKSMDPTQRESIERESSDLALAAMEIRAKQKGGEPPDYGDSVLGVVRALSEAYVNRMKANQAKSGQAFMNDPLIKTDITFCKQVATLVPHKTK